MVDGGNICGNYNRTEEWMYGERIAPEAMTGRNSYNQ